MGNNHKSELEAVTELLVKYRDERNAYYAKTQKEIERLTAENAEMRGRLERLQSEHHFVVKASQRLREERDALKAQAEKFAEALAHYDSAHYCNENYPCTHDTTAREALTAWREFTDRSKQGEKPQQED